MLLSLALASTNASLENKTQSLDQHLAFGNIYGIYHRSLKYLWKWISTNIILVLVNKKTQIFMGMCVFTTFLILKFWLHPWLKGNGVRAFCDIFRYISKLFCILTISSLVLSKNREETFMRCSIRNRQIQLDWTFKS